MSAYQTPFTRTQLWRGAILGTIAHATWISSHPELAHEQSWDGPNYSVQNSSGAYGTITFAESGVVGVFFDVHSSRSPFHSTDVYELDTLLDGMPATLSDLAHDEALQYVLQEYKNTTVPIITAAFWTDQQYLMAAEPWPQVLANGAYLVSIQLMSEKEAITAWRNEYDFTPLQVRLVRSIFTRKVAEPKEKVVLTKHDFDILTSVGITGLNESCELLAQISVFVQ